MTSVTEHQSVWQMDKDHFIHPYTDFSVFGEEGSQVISSAKGVTVTDDRGRDYLDSIAGLWCVNIGHGREEMADAIRDQVLKMQYYNPLRPQYQRAGSQAGCEAGGTGTGKPEPCVLLIRRLHCQ